MKGIVDGQMIKRGVRVEAEVVLKNAIIDKRSIVKGVALMGRENFSDTVPRACVAR